MKYPKFLSTAILAIISASFLLTTFQASAQTVTLRMSTWLPPKHHLIAKTLPAWIKSVSEASGGKIKIKIDLRREAQPWQKSVAMRISKNPDRLIDAAGRLESQYHQIFAVTFGAGNGGGDRLGSVQFQTSKISI